MTILVTLIRKGNASEGDNFSPDEDYTPGGQSVISVIKR